MEIKAKFARLTAQQGKVQLVFELDEACGWALPELATLAGSPVMVSIVDPQQQIDLDAATDGAAEAEPLPFGGRLPEAVEVAAEEAEQDALAGEAEAEAMAAELIAQADAADAQDGGEPYDGDGVTF